MTHQLMVLDDEALIAWGIADEMEERGWAVPHVLGTAAAAMAALDGGAIDAAIIDFNLRGETSEGVARRLIEKGIPFVFVSGSIPTHFPDFGAPVRILQKPIDFPQLATLLRDMVGSAVSQEALPARAPALVR